MISKLRRKLQDRAYREAFVRSQITIGIPFQIQALLKSRKDWTQADLADRAGMKQPRISDLLKPGKVRPNIETLRRIAAAFDCGLIVRFAPFSELARWSEDFDADSFNVASFSDDIGFIERKPVAFASADVLRQSMIATGTDRVSGEVNPGAIAGEIQNVYNRPEAPKPPQAGALNKQPPNPNNLYGAI